MKLPRTTFGNCIQQTAYALLRGWGHRLVVLKSRSRVWPIHLAIEFERYPKPWGRTRDNVTHYAFESEYTHEAYAPWWFAGKWRVIDTHKVAERKRFTLSPRMGTAFTLALVALVMPAWFIAWALWQPCFMAWWMREAIQHRRYRDG
jgi:hypothetical protein